ncbi:MAG TPA: o-succinylbenzoate synthase [Terriglobia bacterium]|nr:o-succinylbenzoate synthase [Terriglobia bacterium]
MTRRRNILTVSAIRLHWVQIPLHEPFRISSGEVSTKDAILVELEARGQGVSASFSTITGWGEASPMAGGFYSAETPETTWDALRCRLVPSFLKQPELDPRRCSERLAEFPGEPFAKAGLEGAVWDLWAQLNSRPLWAELGDSEHRSNPGANQRPLASGAAIGLMPTVDLLLERVAQFLDEGYRRIKIKIEPGHDVELVRTIRQRFGNIPLMVDANAAYCPEDRQVFDELDGLGLMMIEQPLAREALAEHAELQRCLRTPICLDESADTIDSIREIIRLRSARVLNIKVQRMGGLWPARQAHNLALSAGIPCWLGTMPELGIASAQGLHLSTLPNFRFPTDVEASERWYVDDIIAPPIEVSREGFIKLPEGPGMGYRVDLEKVSRYRVSLEELRP